MVHTTLATHATLATLAALGVIFQAFPALCPFEPRRPRRGCKPYPVALVPTLGCFRPPPPSLLLLTSALSGSIIPGSLYVDVKTVLIFLNTSSYTARKETPAHPYPDAFALASTNTRPRGGNAPVYRCLHLCPRTHGEIRVETKSGLNRAWIQSNGDDTHSLALLKPKKRLSILNLSNSQLTSLE